MKDEMQIRQRLQTIELCLEMPEVDKVKANSAIKELRWVLE